MTANEDGRAHASARFPSARPLSRRRSVSRGLVGLALALLLAGDKPASSQAPAGVGIDPLEVLNLQVKPNVLLVFDTSGSMARGFDNAVMYSGDDPASRLYQGKEVLKAVLDENRGRANFGFATYAVLQSGKRLSDSFLYATLDTNATNWSGTFFPTDASNTPGTGSASVKSSFGRNSSTSPTGCTPGNCRYYIESRYARDNVRFSWNSSGNLVTAGGTAITCPLPQAGLFPADPNSDADPSRSDVRRPCFQHVNSAGAVTTFFFSGTYGSWGLASGQDNCAGAAVLANVAACQDDPVDAIKGFLKPELPRDGSCGEALGVPCDLTMRTAGQTGVEVAYTNPAGALANSHLGILSGGLTPIGASLRHVYNNYATIYPSVVPNQKSYVILVTDGDDTCTSLSDSEAWARSLYDDKATTTFVIAVGPEVSNVNSIARAGSGNQRDAFTALTAEQLADALTQALNEVVAVGTFSASQSVTEGVFEYAALVTGKSPLDPTSRYDAEVPTTVQPSFAMPNFVGGLKAYQNDNATTAVWDASAKLLARANFSGCASGGSCRLDELIGGGSLTDASIVRSTDTKVLKRRIYTTAGNGVNPTRVTLWPPTVNLAGSPAGVAPGATLEITAANSPAGLLDKALGIDTLTFAQLQSQFKACLGTNLPSDCGNSTNRTAVARREAREMILAYLAGAEAVPASGNPTRSGNLSGTANDFKLLFRRRSSILAESTLASPAMVPPPLENKPALHASEYQLFRDGPRVPGSGAAVNAIAQGFGMRNPDKESPQSAASTNDGNLKPRATVVYHPSNAALHAFRAGPSCATLPTSSCAESGGEELWAFVPYDVLGKLQLLMQPANLRRATHQFLMATSLRFQDVFVPGSFSQTIGGVSVSGSGKWRTVLLMGRGIGGKYLTALDVTGVGPFTRTTNNCGVAAGACPDPVVLWTRGNPDTSDGRPYVSGQNTYNNALAGGDYAAYSKMGQTWSVPAITRVDPATALTMRNPTTGVEYVAWLGSGYGSPSEGTTFFELDVLTGDVVRSVDVGDRAADAPFPDNALVADPAAFIPEQLSKASVGNSSAGSLPTYIYVGDIHGRLWRFAPNFAPGSVCAAGCTQLADFGPLQPIANGVALLGLSSTGAIGAPALPHIYGATGNDVRVAPAGDALPLRLTPPFKIFGLRDTSLGSDPSGGDGVAGPVEVLFLVDLPNTTTPGFRGTSQPAASINANNLGRVFFIGTQFRPAAVVAGGCASQFQSIFYALTAVEGGSAYDFSGQSALIVNQRLGGVSIVKSPTGEARVMVDKAAGTPPPPPPFAPKASVSTSNVYTRQLRNDTMVCR